MGFLELEPDVVYAGASSLNALSPDASQVALRALAGYSTAGGAVGHPVLSAAFFGYADEHSTLHHSIGSAICVPGVLVGQRHQGRRGRPGRVPRRTTVEPRDCRERRRLQRRAHHRRLTPTMDA